MYLTTQGAADLATLVTSAQQDQRRHRRFELSLNGRFMRPNREEHPCRLLDISVGGAGIASSADVEGGERIVAYFDEIGGIEGTVARQFEGGFGIVLRATPHKQQKLCAQITWLINKDQVADLKSRNNDRIAVANKFSTLTFESGESVDCRVLDFSLSGASIGTSLRPEMGTIAYLGKLRCQVVRYHERGIGLKFLDIISPEAARRYFG